MGLLTEKYKAWAKYPENYTAEQVLNQIVADLELLDEEEAKNSVIESICDHNRVLLIKYAYKCKECGKIMESYA